MLNKKNKMHIVNRSYRHLVEVWSLDTEGKNEANETVQVPQLVEKLWCDVNPVRGKEYTELDKLVPEMQYKITTRYRSNLNQAHVLKWQGRELNIKAIVDISGKEEDMEIMCIEKVKVDE